MSAGDIIFIVVTAAVVVGLIVWVVVISARANRQSAASDARLAVELQALAADPPAPAPPSLEVPADGAQQTADSSKEDRLSELANLHSRGLISDDELATARAKILAE
jgi:hypothetical protein